MRKFVLLATFFTVFSISARAQSKDFSSLKKNGVYVEAYLIRHDFSEGFASINYERNFGKKRRTNFRIGIYPDFESTVSIPLTFSWITNPLGKHHFEYGIGAVFRIEHYVDPYGYNSKEWFYDMPALMIPIMYRYQKHSGLFYRGGLNLFISWPTLPSPSFSIGYKF